MRLQSATNPAGHERPVQPPRIRRTLFTRAFLPTWFLFVVVAGAALVGVTPSIEIGFLAILVSLLVVGLPHGAVDHLLVQRLSPATSGDSFVSHPYVRVGLLYLVLGGVYLACWFLAPAASFAAFILLTWFHWGLGDLYSVVAFTGGSHLRTRFQKVLTAAVRGAIPMLVPLVFHPGQYQQVATLVVGSVDTAAAGGLPPVFSPASRLVVAGVVGALVLGSLTLGFVRATQPAAAPGALRGWRIDAGETLLLVGFFAAVPPVLAIGLYFPLWHSLRHVLRVERIDPVAGSALSAGRLWSALRSFAREAAPLTAVALLGFAGLFVALPAATRSVEGLVAVYLVLLSVLTLPHTVVVAWGDWHEGLWS